MIVGFRIDAVEAVKDREPAGNINVESSPTILNMEEKKMKEMKNVLGLEFEFKTLYKPDYGYIRISGEVLFKAKNAKDAMKKWEKSKAIDPEIAVPVLNFVFRKCLTQAIYLSDLLGLPPAIQFPVVKEQKKEKYIG